MYRGSRKVQPIAGICMTCDEAGRSPAPHGESHGIESLGIDGQAQAGRNRASQHLERCLNVQLGVLDPVVVRVGTQRGDDDPPTLHSHLEEVRVGQDVLRSLAIAVEEHQNGSGLYRIVGKANQEGLTPCAASDLGRVDGADPEKTDG